MNNYKVQTDSQKQTIGMGYLQKVASWNDRYTHKSKKSYIPIVYRLKQEDFPPVKCYLPIKFSKDPTKITCLEEELKIHSLICDAYMNRQAFRTYIDDNCDFVADPDFHIWVCCGFHDELIKGCLNTHFTIRIGHSDDKKIGTAMHCVIDNYNPRVYAITMLVKM